MGAELHELLIGDDPGAWERAGFDVEGDSTWLGTVRLRLVGTAGGRGIRSWGFHHAGLGSVDGLATHDAEPSTSTGGPHPNGVRALDHVVVMTPDLDRSIAALSDLGLDLRRTRDTGTEEAPRRQAFFWVGEPILELVGPRAPRGDGPSRFFGLACTVDDLDATAASLGDACGRVKDAVQPGRRIATLRHESLDVSVPVAFMSPHVQPAR